ncbi:substrate-binding domain-containing protein, partial [Mesorhizobium sp. M2A.F.Ca.ET.017.03.2.1]
MPGSATALDDAVDAAAKAGIPFITAAGSITSPNAINVDSNYARWGYDMMTAIGKVKPDSSVLVVEGIGGHPIVVQEKQGADKALSENKGLKVARTVNGNWTANVTKTVVLQAIATNPAPIDAVWTTGSESRVVAEAFAEAGRPAPLITGSITGDALGYWKANPDKYRFEG